MLHVSNLQTYGWQSAIHGMRNAKNSWHLSDSGQMNIPPVFRIGPKDMQLCKQLINAGPDHRKFLRQIFISVDITAPLYWWKEFDTYKVGTTANSTSTMHKLCSKQFEKQDFSVEDVTSFGGTYVLTELIKVLEELRLKAAKGDKVAWRELIQLLPSSYNQTRTVTMNYEVAMKMFFARRSHKLIEWHILCDTFANDLPYFGDFFLGGRQNEG